MEYLIYYIFAFILYVIYAACWICLLIYSFFNVNAKAFRILGLLSLGFILWFSGSTALGLYNIMYLNIITVGLLFISPIIIFIGFIKNNKAFVATGIFSSIAQVIILKLLFPALTQYDDLRRGGGGHVIKIFEMNTYIYIYFVLIAIILTLIAIQLFKKKLIWAFMLVVIIGIPAGGGFGLIKYNENLLAAKKTEIAKVQAAETALHKQRQTDKSEISSDNIIVREGIINYRFIENRSLEVTTEIYTTKYLYVPIPVDYKLIDEKKMVLNKAWYDNSDNSQWIIIYNGKTSLTVFLGSGNNGSFNIPVLDKGDIVFTTQMLKSQRTYTDGKTMAFPGPEWKEAYYPVVYHTLHGNNMIMIENPTTLPEPTVLQLLTFPSITIEK